jgi:hypothetical protein
MTTSRRELLPGTVAVAGIPGSFAGAGPRLPMRQLGTTGEPVAALPMPVALLMEAQQ